MDDFGISEVDGPGGKKRPAGRLWNVLTIVALLATLCIAITFLVIYIDPNSSLNPFPPPTTFPTLTPTIAPRYTLVPTWTSTPVIIQPTETPGPTHTPLPTGSVVEAPTSDPPPRSVVAAEYAFVLQRGSPTAIDGAQFHPDAGCNWSGVAGQATSMNGEAVKGLFIQLGGTLPGANQVDNLTMTGLAPQYGQGGFEITLSDKLVATAGTLWIQLLDQQNLPLSDRVYFSTYDDCSKNLVIIYFDQVR